MLEVRPDGGVKVHFRGWASSWDKVVKRDLMQLAPDEVSQPAKTQVGGASAVPMASNSPAPPAASPIMRTWSDPTGTHKIEATFLALVDGKVQMKRKDGKEISVPLEKLSQADQQYVSEIAGGSKARNSFGQ